MTGESFREQLKRPEGHFSNGAIVTAGGKRMIRFQVDFVVTLDNLQVLNQLRSGIRYCEKVHMSKASRHIVFVQIASDTENEAIRIALAYRTKVNEQFDRMMDRSIAQRAAQRAAQATQGSIDLTDNASKPTTVVFSGPSGHQ